MTEAEVDEVEAIINAEGLADGHNEDLAAVIAMLRAVTREREALRAERDEAIKHRDDYETVTIEAGIELRKLKARVAELESWPAEAQRLNTLVAQLRQQRDDAEARVAELEQAEGKRDRALAGQHPSPAEMKR